MKKTAAAALVLLGALLAGCSKTETPAPAAATPAPAAVTKIVVGLDDNFPPMGFRDEKNELVGFDIDIAKALCEDMKATCTFVTNDWDGIIPALQAKKFDAIVASVTRRMNWWVLTSTWPRKPPSAWAWK